MPLVNPDRVLVTSTTTGTGTYTLGSAVTGYQDFAAVGNANTCYYVAYEVDGNGNPSGGWEVGLGTYTASGTTLARTTILASSNSGSAVNWTAGTRRVAVSLPASQIAAFNGTVSAISGAEISVTGATTATLERLHVCSGTSADYTLTLPSPTGHAGKLIGVRMSAALTRLVTIDAGSGVTIDGQQTRVMWAQESAVLLCDGTGWTKIAGRSRPMVARGVRTSSQSVANATNSKLSLNTVGTDNTGFVVSTTNGRLQIVRPATYQFTASVAYNNVSAQGNVQAQIWKNGVSTSGIGSIFSGATMFPIPVAILVDAAAVGDFYELYARQVTGASQNIYFDENNCQISLVEVPQW